MTKACSWCGYPEGPPFFPAMAPCQHCENRKGEELSGPFEPPPDPDERGPFV